MRRIIVLLVAVMTLATMLVAAPASGAFLRAGRRGKRAG